MTILIKKQDQVKLYKEPLSLSNLTTFVEKEFNPQGKWKLVLNMKGERQTISSETDLKIIEEQFKTEKFVKLIIQEQVEKSLKRKSCNKSQSIRKIKEESREKPMKEKKDRAERRKNQIEKRCFRLGKILGGEPTVYEEYVTESGKTNFRNLLVDYCKQNNIDLPAKMQNRPEIKMTKLGFFFNKDASEFRTLVEEQPELNFQGLLKVLKGKGAEFTQENFQIMREKMKEFRENLKKERKEKRQEVIQLRKLEKKEKNIENREKKIENREERIKPEKKEMAGKKKSPERQVKKEENQVTLKIMRELFGAGEKKGYMKFIRNNNQLTREELIEKWQKETH